MGQHVAHALIGNTDKRSRWIGQTDGTFPTYPGPIPVAEVERQLFNWSAVSAADGSFIPCERADANWFDASGNPFRISLNDGRQNIVRSDDGSALGHHSGGWTVENGSLKRSSSGYKVHDYRGWLLHNVRDVLQNTLSVFSALTLKNGAQAAVEIGLDETVHDSTTGAEFWPFLLAVTSLDGSIATTYSAFNRMLICDNMFSAIHKEAKGAGKQFKIRHTTNSLTATKMSDIRVALSILDQTAHGMSDYIAELSRVPVERKQWLSILDIIEPPATDDDTKQKQTKTANRREMIDTVYSSDPMAAPWNGTAFGVLQAVDAYQQNYAPVRGTSRLERVYDRAIRGEFAAEQVNVLGALATVLDMPQLVAV